MTPVTRNLLFQQRQKRRVRRMASRRCGGRRGGISDGHVGHGGAFGASIDGAATQDVEAHGAVALRALTDGKMPVKCVPGRLAMARLRPDAFPGGNPWQVLRSMHPESGLGREGGASWQDSRAVHPKRAGFGKICAPCIRKAPQTAVGGYTARRSCQEGALFAARAPRIMHGAQILPSGVGEPP